MVGIILATHGDFATGILQSGSMIFGDQDNVKAVTLQPNDGPTDIKKKMEEAVKSFDQSEEVLILVDLKGGTPYNQSNVLMDGHEDKWAIVAGLNLPMLIEAYGSRMTMESAHEIATALVKSGKDGVLVTPEELAPKSQTKEAVVTNQGAIPEGTVLGNGKIDLVHTRIDSRLLHGQVATVWTKTMKPNRIIVVSDAVARDDLRKRLIQEAAPPGVYANVVPIDKMIEVSKDQRFGDTKALLLFETPQDALRAIEGGVDIKEINVGSMAHSTGKVIVNKAISLGMDDVDTFEKLKARGITFDVRKVPSDTREDMNEILKKAKIELRK